MLCTEITKSHQNNHICQHRGMKTSTVTPSFYYVFNISLYCNDTLPSFIGNLWRVLLPGNHLNVDSSHNKVVFFKLQRNLNRSTWIFISQRAGSSVWVSHSSADFQLFSFARKRGQVSVSHPFAEGKRTFKYRNKHAGVDLVSEICPFIRAQRARENLNHRPLSVD